jgi:Ca2+-binding EF-hand superfamily protein
MADRQAITDFFNYCDTDHDGYITVEEIRQACGVDLDGNGIIDQSELDTGSAPWLAVINTQDLNGDHKISLQELLAYNGL